MKGRRQNSYTNITDNVGELSAITEVCMVYKEVPALRVMDLQDVLCYDI